MSLMRPVLNLMLRLFEQPYLARVNEPADVRASFDRKARLMFRSPRGTRCEWDDLGGVRALRVCHGQAQGDAQILYLHGGAYVFGSPRSHQGIAGQMSRLTGLPVWLPHYRLAPEHPFPAALDDALAACRAMPSPVIIAGDSAGGGLALALLARICAEGLPQPLMTISFSPFADMTYSGGSIKSNARAEVMLPVRRLEELREMYLQGADPRDPRCSPLFADFKGAGPVVMTASDSEILRDDARRMAARLRGQGVAADLIEGRGLPHAWPYFHPILPEARATLRDIAARIARVIPPSSPQSGS